VCLGVGSLVLASSISCSHGHAGSKVLELVDTLLNPVGRTDNVHRLAIVGARRENNAAASFLQEVVQRAAAVADDELVAATLNRSLLEGEMLLKMLSTTLKLSLDLLGRSSVTRDGDGKVGLRRKRHGLVAHSLGRGLRAPGVVLGNLDVDILTLRKLVRVDVVWAGQEGVELGGNVLEAQVDSRGTLVDNGINLATSHLSGKRISLDVDVDNGVLFLVSLSLRDLDTGAGALANLLDLGTLTTNDVGANRGRDGDIDRLLR
jgi:hypothetical protein